MGQKYFIKFNIRLSMGVHYFYTWITRRYPLFKKSYDPEIVPAIDNMYIDLNGVIHLCAKDHALFRDMLKGKKMNEIFINIMNYLNFLINLVKPKKRVFIAVDGVAPRAKNENQRHRRFLAAKDMTKSASFL